MIKYKLQLFSMLFAMAAQNLIIKRAFSKIANVTVIGGGLMGSGIAQIAAQSGNNVKILEIKEDALKKCNENIAASLSRVAKKMCRGDVLETTKFIEETQSRIKGTTSLDEAIKDSHLILEAVVENIDVKHQLFKELDAKAQNDTIFASNTSSLPIGEIARVTNRLDRFGGLHFFNPVPVMKLLEVIKIPETSEDTYKLLMNWGKSIGKVCVTCKDTPGFIVNRLLVPYKAEAFRMYERGDASFEDIDIAMKLGAGYPMGPFELGDYTGHDTGLAILEGWHKKYPDNPLFEVPEVLKKMVKEGKLGRKTGEGFYKYQNKK